MNLKLAVSILLLTVAATAVYTLLLLGFGKVAAPEAAMGSPIRDQSGEIVGSRLVAQAFVDPAYLWPRPSAVSYAADASGGSNLATTNPALRERIIAEIAHYGSETEPEAIPVDLVSASGSGLDPDITLAGALFQAPRIARVRGIDPHEVRERFHSLARTPNPWSPPLVNVLEANLALDAVFGRPGPHP